MAEQIKVIGPRAAYAIAVQEGYTGSKSDWAAEIGNAQANAQIAQAAADKAEGLVASLPNDFTEMADDMNDLKSDYNDTLDLLEAIRNALMDEDPEEAINLIDSFLLDHGKLA